MQTEGRWTAYGMHKWAFLVGEVLLRYLHLESNGGHIQAWAFSDVPPKPPLYDRLRPFPIWPIWVFLLMPLGVLSLHEEYKARF